MAIQDALQCSFSQCSCELSWAINGQGSDWHCKGNLWARKGWIWKKFCFLILLRHLCLNLDRWRNLLLVWISEEVLVAWNKEGVDFCDSFLPLQCSLACSGRPQETANSFCKGKLCNEEREKYFDGRLVYVLLSFYASINGIIKQDWSTFLTMLWPLNFMYKTELFETLANYLTPWWHSVKEGLAKKRLTEPSVNNHL